jgi:hypothetical protein
MAGELTQLESKLGEILGLAQAAQESTGKVLKLVDDRDVAGTLERMHQEAAETEKRATNLAGQLSGKKGAVQRKARETRNEAREMMKTYLGKDADGLDGLEFLTMAEAGELGHVEIVKELNKRAKHPGFKQLADWAMPIQQRHVKDTRKAALALAAQEDPNGPA